MKNRSTEDNQKFIEDNNIKATGLKVPRPVQSFKESGLPKYLIDILISDPKFINPSLIQSLAWPTALQGRDLFGVAETGSGKTLAFMLPGIVHVMAQPIIKANIISDLFEMIILSNLFSSSQHSFLILLILTFLFQIIERRWSHTFSYGAYKRISYANRS